MISRGSTRGSMVASRGSMVASRGSPGTAHTFAERWKIASRGRKQEIKVDSTVAKMQAKRKAEESERLGQAQGERERRECGVLLSRIRTKREHLEMVQSRLEMLQNHNIFLKKKIEEVEADVFNEVQAMLQRCSRFVGSKQFMNRAHRIDIAEAQTLADGSGEKRDTELDQLRELLRRLDEEVNKEVAWMKGLIVYRDRTSRADDERKSQLNQKIAELSGEYTREQEELRKTIGHAMDINRSTLQDRIDHYLGGVLDDQLKVIGADVTVHSLTKEDLLVVIKEIENEVNSRKKRVRGLRDSATELQGALAWNTGSAETGHLFHRLPSWQDDAVGRRLQVAASLRGLAATADVPQGYSKGTTLPPFPIV